MLVYLSHFIANTTNIEMVRASSTVASYVGICPPAADGCPKQYQQQKQTYITNILNNLLLVLSTTIQHVIHPAAIAKLSFSVF